MRVYFKNSAYFTGGNESKRFSSLRRLIEYLVEERKVFSIPLESTIHERRTSLNTIKVTSKLIHSGMGACALPEEEDEEKDEDFDERIANKLKMICTQISENRESCHSAGQSSNKNASSDGDQQSEPDYENTDDIVENTYEERYPCIGEMSSEEAGDLLKNKPDGSWILRDNESGEKRIALKKPGKIMHIRLFEHHGMYAVSKKDPKKPLEELLHSMEEQGTLREQITEREL